MSERVRIKKIANKFRIVGRVSGRISREPSGRAVDGGGHKFEANAFKQEKKINQALTRKNRKK